MRATSVDFGAYDPFSGADASGTGNIAITCSVGVPYSISLSSGSGTYRARSLTSGADVLYYNLYTDASRHVVWGDGAGATATVGGAGTGIATNIAAHGRIPARQNARAGAYSDDIVVTVDF